MDPVSQAIDEVMNDPKKFMTSFWEKTRVSVRKAELEKFGMDEVRSKRGWYGYELPGCQWNEHYRQTIDEANWHAWPHQAPKYIIKTTKDGGDRTCLLLRRAVLYMPDKEWEDLMDEIKKVKDDYPIVDESVWSEIEMEHQDEAWKATYRGEFRDALRERFDGAFVDLQWGDRIQDKFNDVLEGTDFVDDLFYEYMRRGRGGEWTEHSDGSMSIDVQQIVDELVFQDVVNALWPEDPRQLHLKLENLAESIVSRLLGEDEAPHDYSCVMIKLPEELAQKIIAWGKANIADKDLYVDGDGGKGREEEIHVTVKYGLTAAHPNDRLKEVFNKTPPFDLSLRPVSLFKNDDFDVVKLEVHSPYLMALNRNVHAVAEAPGDKHPVYNPHVTVAYVKPGRGDRLEGQSPFDDSVKLGVTSIEKEGQFTAKAVVFSSTDGSKKEYPLGHSNLTAEAAEEPIGDAGDVSPEAMDAIVSRAIPTERKMGPTSARRLFGRAIVDRVEISSAEIERGFADFPGHSIKVAGALLEIYFFVGSELQVWRDEWHYRPVLADALRRWTNLQGAKLVVDGKDAGTVDYNNPILAKGGYLSA